MAGRAIVGAAPLASCMMIAARSAAERSTGAQRFVLLRVANWSLGWVETRYMTAMPLGVVGTTPRRAASPMVT